MNLFFVVWALEVLKKVSLTSNVPQPGPKCRDDMTFLVPNCRDPSGYPPTLHLGSDPKCWAKISK